MENLKKFKITLEVEGIIDDSLFKESSLDLLDVSLSKYVKNRLLHDIISHSSDMNVISIEEKK